MMRSSADERLRTRDLRRDRCLRSRPRQPELRNLALGVDLSDLEEVFSTHVEERPFVANPFRQREQRVEARHGWVLGRLDNDAAPWLRYRRPRRRGRTGGPAPATTSRPIGQRHSGGHGAVPPLTRAERSGSERASGVPRAAAPPRPSPRVRRRAHQLRQSSCTPWSSVRSSSCRYP